MKNCNFISAGAATAKTYVECEKNEANLFHRRARAHPNGAHALTYSSQKADTHTHKKHKPKQSSRKQPPKMRLAKKITRH
jgi:hypothetical protein